MRFHNSIISYLPLSISLLRLETGSFSFSHSYSYFTCDHVLSDPLSTSLECNGESALIMWSVGEECCSGTGSTCVGVDSNYDSKICEDPAMYNGNASTMFEKCDADSCDDYWTCTEILFILENGGQVSSFENCTGDSVDTKFMLQSLSNTCCK